MTTDTNTNTILESQESQQFQQQQILMTEDLTNTRLQDDDLVSKYKRLKKENTKLRNLLNSNEIIMQTNIKQLKDEKSQSLKLYTALLPIIRKFTDSGQVDTNSGNVYQFPTTSDDLINLLETVNRDSGQDQYFKKVFTRDSIENENKYLIETVNRLQSKLMQLERKYNHLKIQTSQRQLKQHTRKLQMNALQETIAEASKQFLSQGLDGQIEEQLSGHVPSVFKVLALESEIAKLDGTSLLIDQDQISLDDEDESSQYQDETIPQEVSISSKNMLGGMQAASSRGSDHNLLLSSSRHNQRQKNASISQSKSTPNLHVDNNVNSRGGSSGAVSAHRVSMGTLNTNKLSTQIFKVQSMDANCTPPDELEQNTQLHTGGGQQQQRLHHPHKKQQYRLQTEENKIYDQQFVDDDQSNLNDQLQHHHERKYSPVVFLKKYLLTKQQQQQQQQQS